MTERDMTRQCERESLRAPFAIAARAAGAHQLQGFFKLFGLHWCPAEFQIGIHKDGETQAYEHHLDIQDHGVNRGHFRNFGVPY